MQFGFAIELAKVLGVVGDEDPIILKRPFPELPVRSAFQAKVLDMIGGVPQRVGDTDEAGVQALVDQK